MWPDLEVTRRLPLADVDVVVGPLTLRQAMLARSRAATSERPDGFSDVEWEALHVLAAKVRRLGAREGVTADEMLDMADADTATISDAAQEVAQREGRFRRPAPRPAMGPGAGGSGDRVDT